MSILIKGMEMPKDCRECPLRNYHIETGETWCVVIDGLLATDYGPILFDGRDPDCPLVEIKTPHGRLIDADALMKSVKKWLPPDPCGQEEKEYPYETDICVSMIMEIEETPTVIEAEEE